ncbi:MAG: subtilisin-like proprotein convertase family protein [Flavobacteriales bacterium]|jgi:subtilisin-like proprotein convertase family protein
MNKVISGLFVFLISVTHFYAQCDSLNYGFFIDSICPGESTQIPIVISPANNQILTDTSIVQIPDTNGINLVSNIFVSGNNGITIQNNQQVKICLDIEHSYIGDLEIMLTSPDSIHINIFNSYTGNGLFPGGFGGGGAYLGGASKFDTLIGICETYCFSMEYNALPSFNNGYNTMSASGNSGGSMVVPGTYNPEDDFSAFIGSPVDGTWSLTIKDNLSIDDGWVCGWSLEVGPSLYSGNWNTSIGISDSTNANPVFSPEASSTYMYFLSDSLGTCFDTLSVDLFVRDSLPDFIINGSISVNEYSFETYNTSYDSTLNYNWVVSNGTIVSGQGTHQIEIEWNGAPYGIIQLEVYNECSSFSDPLHVGIGVASIDENFSSLLVYPNPSTNGIFKFETNQNIDRVEIRNSLGLIVESKKIQTSNLIYVNELPNGYYVISFYSNNGVVWNQKVSILR